MLRKTLLPEPNGTSLGNVATFTLETAGRTYHNLRFQALGVGAGTGGTGTVLDIRNVVEYVRVLVNSKEVMKFNPKELRCLRDYDNVTNDSVRADFLDIPLSRVGVPGSDWPTGQMKKFQVELKLVAALPVPGGSPNPLNSFTGFKAWGSWEPWADAPLGNVVTLQTHTPKMPAVGWNTIEVIPALDNIANIRSIYLVAPAVAPNLTNAWARTNISAVKVSIGGEEVLNTILAENDREIEASPYRILPTQYGFLVMFDTTGSWKDYGSLLGPDGRRLSFKLEYEVVAGATPETVVMLIDGVQPASAPPAA